MHLCMQALAQAVGSPIPAAAQAALNTAGVQGHNDDIGDSQQDADRSLSREPSVPSGSSIPRQATSAAARTKATTAVHSYNHRQSTVRTAQQLAFSLPTPTHTIRSFVRTKAVDSRDDSTTDFLISLQPLEQVTVVGPRDKISGDADKFCYLAQHHKLDDNDMPYYHEFYIGEQYLKPLDPHWIPPKPRMSPPAPGQLSGKHNVSVIMTAT